MFIKNHTKRREEADQAKRCLEKGKSVCEQVFIEMRFVFLLETVSTYNLVGCLLHACGLL